MKFLLLFFAIIFFLLAACGAQPPITRTPGAGSSENTPLPPADTATVGPGAATRTASPTEGPSPTSALGIDPEALEGLAITLWHPWSGELGQAIQDSLTAFNTGNPYGIVAEPVYQGNYNDLYAEVDAAPPDALPNLVLAYTYQVRAWDSGGKPVRDLDVYANDPQWGFTPADRSDFYPAFLESDAVEGKRFGFPAQRNAQVIYYNASWARELGFDSPPETAEDFKDQACAAARARNLDEDASNDGTGGWAINTTPPTILSWMYAFGSEVLSPGGDGYRFNAPPVEEMVAFLNGLNVSGCAWEPPSPYVGTEFSAREALFVSAPLTDFQQQEAEFDRAGNNDAWAMLPYPSPDGQPAITVYGPAWAVFPASGEEDLAAWLLVKWLAAPEQQARIVAAGGSLPLTAATLDHLAEYADENPLWSEALELLDYARPEPSLPSWSLVRWVVGDVGTQIFRYYFTPDRTAGTLELMDETAAELNARFNGETSP